MTTEYIKLYKSELFDVTNKGKTALLYAAGPVVHHSDGRDINNLTIAGGIVIKSQVGFNVHNIAKRFDNIDYVSINGNTCSSSCYSFHEAKQLLEQGFDDVIVYAEEVTESTQVLLFEQLGADVTCGNGVVRVHLTKSKTNKSLAEITDTCWVWCNDKSPMSVSSEGYKKIIRDIGYDCDVVKPHSTGTDRNDTEEDTAISDLLPKAELIKYKQEIGHTQGASTAIEICMLLEDARSNDKTTLCLASGMGGFYGGIRIVR